MGRLILGLTLLLASLAAPAQNTQPPVESNPAGKVELIEGAVTVYGKTKKPRSVAVGDTLFEGDGIVTGSDGEVHVGLDDGGFIAVRPNTNMSIAAYRAEGGDRDQSIFSLLAGTFRSVTGWIGKYNPRSYQVRTPTATIGVRGTDHEPLVIPQGSREGEPGTYDKVNVGGTTLSTAHGRIDVSPNRAGFAPWKGRPVPRLLPQVPAFFKARATRNEAAIAARHAKVQKLIEKRRDERRALLKEKKAQLDKRKTGRQQARQERRKQNATGRRDKAAERNKQRQAQQQKRREGIAEGRDKRLAVQDGRIKRGNGRDQAPRGGGRGRD
jgi:hypothetical protein